ncbi:uncharacterized protein [Nicotiana sylvestris]|uniref:uncharacterized protein n=1 Tax=Nicotiana sylvestris TaxID=4096 RepID=UPI00388C9D09
MGETHYSGYSIHLGATKIYHNIREVYWWDGKKKDIAEFVVQCPNCYGDSVMEMGSNQYGLHRRLTSYPAGSQFIANFFRSFQKELGTQMAPYEALYGRKCRSPIRWFDVREYGLHGPDLVQQAIEKGSVTLEPQPTTFLEIERGQKWEQPVSVRVFNR